MTLPKFVARTTHITIINGKRKLMCAKGDTISVTKWNTMTDKLKSYFEPVDPDEYRAYLEGGARNAIKSDAPATDADMDKYETLKQMMAQQESSVMAFYSNFPAK